MSATVTSPSRKGLSRGAKRGIVVGVIVVVLVAMGFGTKVVGSDSALAKGPESFNAQKWGEENFPKVQKAIEKRAVDAATLAQAIAADPAAAGKKYGVTGGTGPEISVRFTGVAGQKDPATGIYPVTVDGVPSTILIRVQTGPAINGTDLRDAPGTITFGDFTNQIDYQNAASALNDQLKQKVLAKVDTANLQGKTITVVGAFQLINPNGWLVTPATLSVQ